MLNIISDYDNYLLTYQKNPTGTTIIPLERGYRKIFIDNRYSNKFCSLFKAAVESLLITANADILPTTLNKTELGDKENNFPSFSIIVTQGEYVPNGVNYSTLGSYSPIGVSAQQIYFNHNKLPRIYGAHVHIFDKKVIDASDVEYTFVTIVHELVHTLGIMTHNIERQSIMHNYIYSHEAPYKKFTETDRFNISNAVKLMNDDKYIGIATNLMPGEDIQRYIK